MQKLIKTLLGIVLKDDPFLNFINFFVCLLFFLLSLISLCNEYDNFIASSILKGCGVSDCTTTPFNLKISALEPSPTVSASYAMVSGNADVTASPASGFASRTADVPPIPSSTLLSAQSSVGHPDVSGYHFSWINRNFYPSIPKFYIILLFLSISNLGIFWNKAFKQMGAHTFYMVWTKKETVPKITSWIYIVLEKFPFCCLHPAEVFKFIHFEETERPRKKGEFFL